MAYSATYTVADIDDIIIDFIGTVMAALVDNALILVTLIILGIIVYLTRDLIRNLIGGLLHLR